MNVYIFAAVASLAGASALSLPPRPTATCCASLDTSADSTGASVATAQLERVKELAGTWVELGEDGRPSDVIASRYSVTAGGHAVLETLFPGTEHEMVSLYHVDADALVLTHYCVLGNHPRMLATLDPATDELVFTCSGNGLNFRSCDEVHHMHEGRVRRIGTERLESRWTPWLGGQPQEPTVFSLARVPTR